ncbi:Por secretion system C-terminal sorting domain-containing protein [Chitinophaga filiformis]|uniref:Por secretion system C-terminal sorting domain-containing protein n=2 Tax=Chitinophaga filiformis TaxID=104663 RepID=A0A1G7RWX7_CHIFI|nr:Por secretion system C-terminal sorting domain-containing protein [Chitinophaga filiformis]
MNIPLMKSKFTLIACLMLLQTSLWAQQGILQMDTASNGKVKFMRLDTKKRPQPVANAQDFMKQTLKMSLGDSLRLDKVITDKDRDHRLYQQYYKGYKVPTGTYAVHSQNGIIESANGFFQDIGKPSVQVKVDEKTALKNALGFIHARTYGWEDEFTQKRYQEVAKDPKATLYPKGELVIIKDDSITHSFRLAYKFHIYAVAPLSDNNVYVDAITGNVIGKEQLIMDANTPGFVTTLYNGWQSVTLDSYTGGYRLRETRTVGSLSAQIQTLDMQNGSNYSAAADFSNGGTGWTTANAGHDVHWGTEKVFDYWASVRGRNSYDNLGGTLFGYVHADLHGINSQFSNNDNAFWDPTMHSMTYGDGTTQFKAVTSLDVIAHEIGHGICQFTAALPGGFSEQGAMNEGLSDIWGAVIEYYATPYKQTWLIGDEIMKNGQPCLRSMIDPNSLSYPDTYHGTYWDYNNEPHKNSTVLSHWFYLLSQGGSGTNDLGNSYSVTGQGISIAADIIWNAESTGKLQSQSQYADARTATINAATELYGAGSCQVKAVTDAWYAVGIGAAPPNANLVISGVAAFCSSSTYTVSGVPAGQTVTWTVAPAGYVTLNASGNSVTLTKTSPGNFTLTASLPNCIFATKAVSTVSRMNITSTQSGPCNGAWQGWMVNCSPNMPLSNYSWTSTPTSGSSINIYSSSSPSSYVSVYGGGGVNITATNACGETVRDGVTVYSSCPRSLVFTVSPNPAVSTVNIQPKSNTDPMAQKATVAPQITSISIYDQMGNLLRKQKYANVNNAQLNVGGLRIGVYYLEIDYDKTKERQQLIIGQ